MANPHRYTSFEDLYNVTVQNPSSMAILDIETHTYGGARIAHPLELGAVALNPTDPKSYLRPENQFRALIRPPVEQIFRPGTDVARLKAIGALGNVEHPETLRAFASENVARAFQLHRISPQSLLEEGKPIEEVIPAFQDWMKSRGVTSATAYNVNYDRTVLERFGLNVKWADDLMYQTSQILGLRRGERSAENAARLLGILGPQEKELHRGLEDAILEARIWETAQNPSAVQSVQEKLKLLRGSRRKVGQEVAQSMFLSYTRTLDALSAKNVLEFGIKNPVFALAISGSALIALGAAIKPLSLIPGKDDAYNTITGLDERGTASQLRKLHTDFGSGYQGLTVMGQPIAPEIQAFREAWFSDLTDQGRLDQLKAAVAASSTEYDQLRPDEMKAVGELQEVDLSNFNTRWDDADTLILRRTGIRGFFFGKDIAVRLAGIDAPEVIHPDDPTSWFRFQQQQPFGAESTAIAQSLTAGKRLKVLIDPGASTYGRHIGLLYAEGEAGSINEQLIAAGAAAHLPFGEAGSDIYDRAAFSATEQQAISEQRGMWQQPFFQTYLDITKGVGGRITLTSFTDMTRLARNYKLAAAQSAMWQSQEGSSVPGAVGIGRSLRSSYGRFFKPNLSSKDDDHLQIEALDHSGVASTMRQIFTNFGSGYTGLFKLPAVLGELGFMGLAGTKEQLATGLAHYAKAAGKHEDAAAVSAIKGLLTQINISSRHQRIALINPMQIELAAAKEGVKTSDVLRKVIRHEKFHTRTGFHKRTANLPADYSKLEKFKPLVPEGFRTEFESAYKGTGMIEQKGGIVEEWLAAAMETAHDRTVRSATQISDAERKFGQAWKVMEVVPIWQRRLERDIHGAVLNAFEPEARASLKLGMAQAQKDAQAISSVNGQLGGKMHNMYTNKSGK